MTLIKPLNESSCREPLCSTIEPLDRSLCRSGLYPTPYQIQLVTVFIDKMQYALNPKAQACPSCEY